MMRAHVVFKGKVQGVFFRAHTQEKAEQLGVKGWVMNARSGDVEAVFEGEEGKVKELIEYCRSGQPHARVDKADIRVEGYKGEFSEFEVRR